MGSGWCWWALQHRDRDECSRGCGQDETCQCSSGNVRMHLWRLWSDCSALWLWQSAIHVEIQVCRVTSSKIWPVLKNTELSFDLHGGYQKLFSASVDHIFDWSSDLPHLSQTISKIHFINFQIERKWLVWELFLIANCVWSTQFFSLALSTKFEIPVIAGESKN